MNVLDIVSKQITEEVERLKDDLAIGSAEDHTHYKYMVGVIAGLWKAEIIISDLNKQLEEFDE